MPRKPRKESLRSRRARAFRFRGATSVRGARGKSKVSWIVKRDWVPEPDPALIVDHIRDIVLAAHREAIRRGQKADGSGRQPTIGPKARRRRSIGSDNLRGFDTGHFADNLTAGAIRVRGPRYKARSLLDTGKTGPGRKLVGPTMTKGARGKPIYGTLAASTIRSDPERKGFVEAEEDRGVEYLYTEGAIERLVDEAVDQAIDVAFVEGGSRDARMGVLRAQETIHK